MGKRKRKSSKDDSELVEEIVKKVKKLVKRGRRIESSSSEDERTAYLLSPENREHQINLVSDPENIDEIPTNETPLQEEEVPDNSLDLEPDILELLGTDPTQDKSFGDNLHKDLAIRWKYILINGLPKDEKSDLLKQYLPAENCTHMKAPKLNLEIKSALSETNLKKDSYSEQKQNQMASCIAAIGRALNLALYQKEQIPQEIIKTLGDAGRLLCDTHYRESVSRRFAIINSISKQKRDIVKNTKIDAYLFGSDLLDHLKSSKAISKSALELKPTTTRRYYQQPIAQPSTSGFRRPETLNARGAPRAVAAEQRVNPPQSRRQGPQLPAPPPPPRGRHRGANQPRVSQYSHQHWRR